MDCPVIEDIIHEEDRFAMMIDGAICTRRHARSASISIIVSCWRLFRCGRLVRACYYTAPG